MPVYSSAKIKQLNADTYKLLDATDIDAGTIDVPVTVGEGGSIAPDGIMGEIAVQTGTGAPTHTARIGTLYWDTLGKTLYCNNDGANTWVAVGGSSAGNTVITIQWPFGLTLALTQLQALLLQITLSPKPSYTVHGHSYSWTQYQEMIVAQIEKITRIRAQAFPFEIVSRGD